jgi:predicted AlkP superfamily phosphohydrolase/phosphomutase
MHPTLLIGLDGATFSILDPLMETGVMPFLKSFVRSGARATLWSTPNPLTPPAWISMMTGRSPGHHGVFDFIWAEERKSDTYFTLNNFRDIQCETLWSVVSRQNGRVGALNFPMMSPPPAVSGYIVPGLVSWKHLRRCVYPPELYDRLKEVPGFNARELAWDFDLEKKASRGVPPEEFENWIEFHRRRERQWFETVRFLMREIPCHLSAVLFDGPDKISHIGWRFLDPERFPAAPSAWERKIRDLCLGYFRDLDSYLAQIAELAGPEARIFMASDHGFGPCWQVFRVNSWLHQMGYLHWGETEHLAETERMRVERLVDRHFVYLDWTRTMAYAPTTTSNGIFIRVADGRGRTGIAPERYETFRKHLMAELLAIKDPASGRPVIKNVLTREEAYPGPHNERAPDLTVVMQDHSFVSVLNKQPIIAQRSDIEGTHYPQGVFLAKGAGIRENETLPDLNIVDVASCLLHSLGLSIPADLEGHVPAGLFRDDWERAHPVAIGEVTHSPQSYALRPEAESLEAEEEKQIFKQLRALGYVE